MYIHTIGYVYTPYRVYRVAVKAPTWSDPLQFNMLVSCGTLGIYMKA